MAESKFIIQNNNNIMVCKRWQSPHFSKILSISSILLRLWSLIFIIAGADGAADAVAVTDVLAVVVILLALLL